VHSPGSVAPERAGFSHGTGYYYDVAPLAQTGMTGTGISAKAVAPGRAGRANCERSELSSILVFSIGIAELVTKSWIYEE